MKDDKNADLDIEILYITDDGVPQDEFFEEPIEALFAIAQYLYKGFTIEMISLVTRVSFDFKRKEIY